MGLDHLRVREGWGTPVSGLPIEKNDGGMMLLSPLRFADMWINIETARLLIWRAMSVFDEMTETGVKEGFDPKIFKSPKLYAAEAAMKTALEARLIFGGLGILRDVGMEKLVRDISAYQHTDGTNDILRLSLARYLT